MVVRRLGRLVVVIHGSTTEGSPSNDLSVMGSFDPATGK
jgi:hypothetical protein